MFLYIIHPPLLELNSVGKNVDYTRGKTVNGYSTYFII